ncbi:hypothetical protein ACVWWI_004888 [Bradyrhizobium sp. USDA 3686]|nr:hypothetical protein [Bradyrhizobium canariense]
MGHKGVQSTPLRCADPALQVISRQGGNVEQPVSEI